MGIQLNMGYTGVKQDYSYLFQSISGNSNLNFLSDYASIKNGSYGKLMKAYYSKAGNNVSKEVSSIVDSKNTQNSASEDSTMVQDTWKASAYTSSGTYDSAYSSGNIFSAYL